MEDRQIVESFLRDRTEETFLPVYQSFCVRVRRYFLLHRLDPHTAEDLAQEVLFKVYRKAGELRDAESFSGWLYAIARNLLVSHWRQQQSRVEGAAQEPLTPELIDSLQTEGEVTHRLRLEEWLEQLSQADRDLVVLRYVEGLSYEELAVALEVPLGTVKWRISEVRRKLSPRARASGVPDPRGGA